MDLPGGDERSIKFITNVGLITSDGPYGPNIISAEWTHHVSYKPGIIAVCIGFGKATLENIRRTKKFGVNIAATDQSAMASVAGDNSGKKIDKISALKELGFEFYAGKNGLPMVKAAAMNAECKLMKEITLGDHVMLVGEVVEAHAPDREPLAYHKGKYWAMSENIKKPLPEEREKIDRIVQNHRRNANGR